MRPLTPLAALALVLSPTGSAAAQAPGADAPEAARIPLRVLYAGSPGTPREAEFRELLGAHFEAVGTTSYSDFRADEADAWDVVVFDYDIEPTPGRIGLGPRPDLPDDWARASVLVGGAGAMLGDREGLLPDWL